ncbi:hypothetical protein EDB83DRAFT_2323277 [Lactarius deliciosus]|nr:hypothetical protein EDB83DRAFT_2323277 [Lactarius deliciosus]
MHKQNREDTQVGEAEREADRKDLAGSPTRLHGPAQNEGPSNSDQPSNRGTPNDTAQPMPPKMPRMIGDFDDSANPLWSLHVKETKSHDEARIQTLKDDMGGVLIFVHAGLFSAALTSFVTDKICSLQVDPAQQMVYYQQQNVALLAQISNQVSSITPHVSIPSTLPPPYPDFSPNSSDIRVNAYWLMSLVSAFLLRSLQPSSNNGNPLKSVRLHQYLYEGAEGWYMPVVAESVPGLVHVSLFLFFLGLSDSLLTIHMTVGVTTIVPITICGLLYVLSTFAPAIKPQSPFRNSFSGLIWYLLQKVHPQSYFDWTSGGALNTISSNMSEGQVQLAMEENDKRKDRDIRVIQWLIHDRTVDDKMESFVMAIPGAFMSKWGVEVWRKVCEIKQCEDTNSWSNDATARSQTDVDLWVSTPPLHHTSSLP